MRLGTNGKEMSVVCGRDHRHGTSGAAVQVAKTVGEILDTVGIEVVLIMEDIVVGWARGSLKTSMGGEEKV
jgi:hypothetical protein